MKLVDILARELKAWPAPKSLLSGSTDYCCQSDNTTEVYFGHGRTPIFLSKRAEDTEGVRVTRAEWQAAVDALNADRVEYSPAMHAQQVGRVTRTDAWVGAGLPPAGTICELRKKTGGWGEAEIKYQGGRGICVWLWIRRDGNCEQIEWAESPDKLEFRPIITVSQVSTGWRQTSPEWSEDGLPNVGTKCVIYKGAHGLTAGAEEFIGPVVTVAARFKSALGVEMACVDSGTALGCHIFRADMCFHLPTAEEVARREREDAIEEMVAASPLAPLLDKGWVRKNCAALYDANYRKQVTK